MKKNVFATGMMPALFIAHGAPPLLDDARWMAELRQWGGALPRPSAILVLSAHWVESPLTLGATETTPLIYDFYGFPKRFYELEYAAPGAPELARRVTMLANGEVRRGVRGLDHGAYIPLMGMYPEANVPVLQISLPALDLPTLFALGRSLAPLRREGVLLAASGFLSHNLNTANFSPGPRVPAWATEFDAWTAEVIASRNVDALFDYRRRAPGVATALPTHEHFAPVAFSMGASVDQDEPVIFPITGFAWGSFTKRSVQFG